MSNFTPLKTFASLFTGGGLADIGAMQAGYQLLWGIEYDPAIAAVANANLTHTDQVYAASVVGLDWSSVERPDHLHMSPPCQDFSVAKTSGKISNDNDALADACIEALRTLRPDTVTLENVEGYRKAPGFQRIVDHLWGAGYWVNVDVLNSADFGVPQTRRRLFLRAVRGGFPGPLPEPVQWRGWYEAIEDLIPELPDTEFADWQLKRLPDELKETFLVRKDEPTMTVTTMMGRRTSQFPYAYLVDGLAGDYQSKLGVKEKLQPWDTVGANTGHKQVAKALLIESKNANQQYGDGVRHADEPHTTVVTDHKPSHQPKILLISDNGSESQQITGREHSDPSFSVVSGNGTGGLKAGVSSRVVRMTPRCLARFQSVPDSYVLPTEDVERFRKMGNDLIKGNGIALACKIIGNGIPCLMMQRVMESFL